LLDYISQTNHHCQGQRKAERCQIILVSCLPDRARDGRLETPPFTLRVPLCRPALHLVEWKPEELLARQGGLLDGTRDLTGDTSKRVGANSWLSTS
jgi:hypothetical protein